MNRLISQILLAASIVILVFVLLTIVVRPKKEYVLMFRPADVVDVDMHSEQGDVVLRRLTGADGERWVVGEHGQMHDADQKTVGVFLANLARLTAVDKFKPSGTVSVNGEQDLFSFGKTAVIKIHLRTGEELVLQVGRMTPSGTEYFVASSLSDYVYAIRNSLYPVLVHEAVDFWSRQIISDISLDSTIIFEMGSNKIHLKKVGNEWRSSDGRVSGNDVSNLLKCLRSLQFTNYFDVTPEANLTRFGLTVPDLKINIIQDGGAKIQYMLSIYGNRPYIAIVDLAKVFILTNESSAALFQALHKIIS